MENYPIITVQELEQIIIQPKILIFDARAGKNAEEEYRQKHLSGARFVSLEKDLTIQDHHPENGGRHPLPTLENFRKTLEKLGLQQERTIIIYDDKNGANAAARFWWMLKAFGIENVKVLSGGIQAALKGNLPWSEGEEQFAPSNLEETSSWKYPTVSMEEVEAVLAKNSATVVDVRDAYRYLGESEPIDLVAGHIPNAINIPFSENLDKEGKFLTKEELFSKYKNELRDHPERVIFHCGSGVTACHSILALVAAGFPVPELYVGSWSEWSRNPKPIAVGNEKK